MAGSVPDRAGDGTEQSGLSPAMVDSLIRRSERAWQAGNETGARAVLRAITRQVPDDRRAWQHLATIGETPAERQSALDHLQAHERAQRVVPTVPTVPPASPPEPAATTEAPAEPADQEQPVVWWLYAVVVVFLGVLLGVLLYLFNPGRAANTAVAPSPTLPVQAAATQAPLPAAANDTGSAAATATRPTAAQSPTPDPTATATTAPTAAPTTTPVRLPEVVGVGTLIEHDGWLATLLNPNHVQLLDEPPADITLEGRLTLAVIAVSNTSSNPRRIPPSLFALVDGQGRLYHPIEGASSAYLARYGRGQYGDRALEDIIAPEEGMRSVPLLFDVTTDVDELILTMGHQSDSGWQVLAPPAPVPTPLPAPAPTP